MNELRVLMIGPTPFFSDRGCHVRILEEIRALQSRGVRILLFTYPNGDDVEGVETVRVGKWTGYDKAEAGPSAAKPLLDLLLLAKVFNGARRFRPHLIHAHLHEGCLMGWPAAWWRKIPLLLDYQGSLTREMVHHGAFEEGGGIFKTVRTLERFIDGRPDVIMPSSSAFSDDIEGGRLIMPVPDALATEDYAGGAGKDEMRSRLEIPPARFVVVFLGLLNEYQGADLLIDVIKNLKDRGREDFLFLIMGYPNVEHYRRISLKVGLNDMVKFTGRVPYGEIAGMLSAGDAAIAPKIAATESNGKVLNYMACGLPTVALDTPVNRELMGDTGVMVEWKGDKTTAADKMAYALANLADDSDFRKRLGWAGARRVVRKFSRPVLAARLMEIYKTVLGDRFPMD